MNTDKKIIKSKTSKLQIQKKVHDYNDDFHAWSLEQASLIKRKEFARLDIEHLVEEIEGLSASDKRALESHLAILLAHLLKIKYQPGKHTRSWDLSIEESRYQVRKNLRRNPSLKRLLPEFYIDAYQTSRREAAYETGIELNVFPEKCPWTIKEVLGE